MQHIKNRFDTLITRDKTCGFSYLKSKEEQDFAKSYLESLDYNVVTSDNRFYTRYQIKPKYCMSVDYGTASKIKGILEKYFKDAIEIEETWLGKNNEAFNLSYELHNDNGDVISHGNFWHSLGQEKQEDRKYTLHAYYTSSIHDKRYVQLSDFEADIADLYKNRNKVGKFVFV